MADDGKKGTGDALRGAIKASSKSALEQLQEHALAREMEILAIRQKYGVPSEEIWQPPTEEAFNREWLTPDEALGVVTQFLEERDRRRWIFNRLKVGEIVAVARTAYTNSSPQRFFGIPRSHWDGWNYITENYFWDSGDATFQITRPRSIPPEATVQCHDVRFDPQGFSGVPTNVRPVDPDIEQMPQAPAASQERPQLPRADAQRFCRAILTEWPQATEDWIREKATFFYPEHRFSRDWFRGILREIRGTVKRGKKPKTDN